MCVEACNARSDYTRREPDFGQVSNFGEKLPQIVEEFSGAQVDYLANSMLAAMVCSFSTARCSN
jgi:hypothetical protein